MTTRNALIVALLALMPAVALAQDAKAPKDDTVIITFDGQPAVTAGDFRELLKDFPPEALANENPAQVRSFVIDRLTGDALLLKAATEANISETDEYKQVLAGYKEFLARELYLRKEFDLVLTDEKLREVYNERFLDANRSEEIRARHILVDEEKTASDIIKKLDDGASFEELAAEYSKDGSAAEGGDLGYFPQGRMVKPFNDAAFALEKGAYTKEPVQSRFGWHVIKLEDRRKEPVPSFDSIKEDLRRESVQALRDEKLKTLYEKHKVKTKDSVIESIPLLPESESK